MKKFLILFLGVFMMLSCEKTEYQFEAGQIVTLSASSNIDSGVRKARGVLENSYVSFIWENNDSVGVTVSGKTSYFHIISGAGTCNAVFKGAMPASGNTFSVHYPVVINDIYNQEYIENEVPKNFYAEANNCVLNKSIVLIPTTSVLQINLIGSDIVGEIDIVIGGSTYKLKCPNIQLTNNSQAFLLVVPTGQYGFTMNVKNGNGVNIKTMISNEKDFTSHGISMPIVEINSKSMTYVDLGFAKWASYNIGAQSEEQYGDYFAWGEAKPYYNQYTSDAYIDAASVNLGSDWKVPSLVDITKLISLTIRKTEVVNGVLGVRYTSILNRNSIFLPFAGYMTEVNGKYTLWHAGVFANYWTSTIKSKDNIHGIWVIEGYALRDNGDKSIEDWPKHSMSPIRPIYIGK